MAYDIGDKIRITATFTNAAGAVADPTALTFRYKTPAEAVTIFTYGVGSEIVKSSTGIYYVDLELSASGIWWYRWAGTGAVRAAVEGGLVVDASRF